MLSLISLGRGLWQKLQSAHPVIRWGGAILVGLLALELIGNEAIDLFIKMQTARPTIEQSNEQARKTKAEADTAEIQRRAMSQHPPGFDDVDARLCAQGKQEYCRDMPATLPEGAVDSILTGKPIKRP